MMRMIHMVDDDDDDDDDGNCQFPMETFSIHFILVIQCNERERERDREKS